MTDGTGRSVRLFLVDGKSTGLITAEIMNWTGHVLTAPRAELPKFLARPEVGRTGVYLLHGRDPADPDRTLPYIGESDQVGTRLKQHNQEDKKKLIADGALQPDPGSEWLILTEDVAFSSPSAAGAVVVGRSANGRIEWKVKNTQQTYAAWQEEQIANAERTAAEPPAIGA